MSLLGEQPISILHVNVESREPKQLLPFVVVDARRGLGELDMHVLEMLKAYEMQPQIVQH